MEHKRFLVLANSYKHHARCVAGRELSADGTFGPWIRPVSHHGDGELFARETHLTSGWQAEVWQYVSVQLERHANNPLQPENWLIHGAGNWIDLDRTCPAYALDALIEHPANLWHDPGSPPGDYQCPRWSSGFSWQIVDSRGVDKWTVWRGPNRREIRISRSACTAWN